MRNSFLLTIIALTMPGHARAQSCDLPVPFTHEFQNNVTTSLSTAGSCALSASTTSASRTTAAAFLHYRRPVPLTSVRYAFRLDTSALSTTTALQQVQLFAATSANVVTLPVPSSTVASIVLRGASPNNQLQFIAADPAQASGNQSSVFPLPGSVNTIRVEVTVGTMGSVKYWINHDFTDAPDGAVEASAGSGVDNSLFGGVIGAEIGLSNATANFRSGHAGEALVFDRIESSDDLLFYDDFTSGAQ